jgi:hypoxanthine phosphoribosyltransferase
MKQKYIHYSQDDIKGFVNSILRDMLLDNFKPDYVVGLTRGGLYPALMISHYLEIPMQTLKVSLRDDDHCESNLWMAEEAYSGKKILIVDDINDSGATLKWIMQDWQAAVSLPIDQTWDMTWNHNVRFAVLVDNENSEFGDVDYIGTSVNKLDEPSWIVFPWEEWWK